MSNIPVAKTKTFEFGGQTVTLETGRIARQADGAVLATIGKTQVLATVVAAKTLSRARISSRCLFTIRKKCTLLAVSLVAT